MFLSIVIHSIPLLFSWYFHVVNMQILWKNLFHDSKVIGIISSRLIWVSRNERNIGLSLLNFILKFFKIFCQRELLVYYCVSIFSYDGAWLEGFQYRMCFRNFWNYEISLSYASAGNTGSVIIMLAGSRKGTGNRGLYCRRLSWHK